MELRIGHFAEVEHMDGVGDLFSGIIDDRTSLEEYKNALSSRLLFIITDKDEFCGIVTAELVDPNYLETHILLRPSKRSLSVKVMREVIRLTKEKGKVPMTNVSGDYPHIKRCLEILGLTVFKVEQGAIIKGGIPYDRIYMEYLK